jgi:hypothetical protein
MSDDDREDEGNSFPPFVRGSDTSLEAAESVADITGRMRRLVYSLIWSRCQSDPPRGATCDEVEAIANMRHQTASARINELAHQKAIHDSGSRRRTRSGRNAAVWVITKRAAE